VLTTIPGNAYIPNPAPNVPKTYRVRRHRLEHTGERVILVPWWYHTMSIGGKI
jgi:hypothetical protein